MESKCCPKCKRELPATPEYFSRNKSRRSGLDHLCKQCDKIKGQEYRKANVEKERLRNKKYADAHPDKAHIRRERHYKNKRDHTLEINRVWASNNVDKRRESGRKGSHIRRARERGLLSDFTDRDWKKAIEYFHGACAYCGNPPQLFDRFLLLHQEHHIPVASGGGYTPTNIVPACQTCNLSKHHVNPHEWIISKFGKRKAKEIEKRIQAYFEDVKGE